MKYLVSLLIIMLTLSCSKSTTESDISIPKIPTVEYATSFDGIQVTTGYNILNRLSKISENVQLGKVKIEFADKYYAIPTKRWLNNSYKNFYSLFMQRTNMTYSERSDCDKLSGYYRLLSCMSHANTKSNTTAEALAIGEIVYRQKGMVEAHSINFAIVGTNFELIFIEPQTCEQVFPTQEELDSIFEVSI